jgi:hypothetical protein
MNDISNGNGAIRSEKFVSIELSINSKVIETRTYPCTELKAFCQEVN